MVIKLKEDDFKKKTVTGAAKGMSGFVKELNNSMQYFGGLLKGFKDIKGEIVDLIGMKKMNQQATPQQSQQILQPVVTPQLPQKKLIDIPAPIGKSVPNKNKPQPINKKEIANKLYDEGLKMAATLKDMTMPQFIGNYKQFKDLVTNKIMEILP